MNTEGHVEKRLNTLNGVGELQEGEGVRDVYGLLCCIAGGFLLTPHMNRIVPDRSRSLVSVLRLLSERASLKFVCIPLSGEGAVLALLSGSRLV